MKNKNNSNGYILNTNSGVLHTKECGDGENTCGPKVAAGFRKHFSKYENAVNNADYVKDHESECCIGK